ncbi:uncharacterized protein LOC122387709 [Amphibalanus amphitrite]|uniref:uncharacterized protein LOC122387709 n=1 Tax=Amphibalanus amphitrite TaxID=1232801 RepID=UPI001C904C35|nr:uncharacterized protein LOC122387709 [Amphibalanus amphitrite]
MSHVTSAVGGQGMRADGRQTCLDRGLGRMIAAGVARSGGLHIHRHKMVRRYTRKTARRVTSPEMVARARWLIADGYSIRAAARAVGLPVQTMRDALKAMKPRSYVSRQVFSAEEEAELSNYLTTCTKMLHGLSAKRTRELAYEFALHKAKPIPANWRRQRKAGVEWLRSFLARNQLSIRKPEATSLHRAIGFTRKSKDAFFNNLRAVMEKNKFPPESIYNLDETGITTVAEMEKVVAQKGAKQVGSITAAERGTLVTVACAVNATGNAMPPFFVFPRVRYSDSFVDGGPAGSDGYATPKGWMTSEVFLLAFQHFVKHAKPSKERPVLLLMDNHESHMSLALIMEAREAGVVILTFPPHCSHRLQPLDVSVYGPVKRFYQTSMTEYMLSHPGRRPSIYDLPAIFRRPFELGMTPSNILSGFRATGIFPLDSNIFPEESFAAESVFIPQVVGNETADAEDQSVLETIRPLPRFQVAERKTGRKKGYSRIITSSPEKHNVEELETKRRKVDAKKRLPQTSAAASPIASNRNSHTVTHPNRLRPRGQQRGH